MSPTKIRPRSLGASGGSNLLVLAPSQAQESSAVLFQRWDLALDQASPQETRTSWREHSRALWQEVTGDISTGKMGPFPYLLTRSSGSCSAIPNPPPHTHTPVSYSISCSHNLFLLFSPQ